jgi:hypothetical protein
MIANVRQELLQTLAVLGTCHPSMRFGQLFEFAALIANEQESPNLLENASDNNVLIAAQKHIVNWRSEQHEPMGGELPALEPARPELIRALEAYGRRMPHSRLGQLIVNLADTAGINTYDIEDEQLLDATKKEYGGSVEKSVSR